MVEEEEGVVIEWSFEEVGEYTAVATYQNSADVEGELFHFVTQLGLIAHNSVYGGY